MKAEVTSNKHGQSLGRKGHSTRKRLMEAAAQLLGRLSPFELTAVAIAKEAGTSFATFYMYFDDVRDILFSLSQAASNEVTAAMENLDKDWHPDKVEEMSVRLVEKYYETWGEHRPILRYRNMEADRGDEEFYKLRISAYQREVKVLTGWIKKKSMASGNDMRHGDAHALAIVVYAALERLASFDEEVLNRGIGKKRVISAEACIVAQVISGSSQWSFSLNKE